MEPSAPPAPQALPTAPPAPPGRVRHPLWGVLVGLLAAVVALALAVVALAAIVWIRTEPVPAPTGPDVNVTATVIVVDGRANAIVSLAASQESAAVGGGVDKYWEKVVHFGETIRVDIVLTDQGENQETFEPGTATCKLTTGTDNKVLRTATASVVGGTATCSWTNTGKA